MNLGWVEELIEINATEKKFNMIWKDLRLTLRQFEKNQGKVQLKTF